MRTWLEEVEAYRALTVRYAQAMEEVAICRGYLKEMRRLMAQREAEAAKVSLRKRLHAYKRKQRAKRKAERR